jgi:hypothetical protein
MFIYLKTPLDWLFAQNAKSIFLLSCLIYILITIFQQEFILSEKLYFNSYIEQMAEERISMIIDSKDKYWWVSYISIPLIIILQILFITLCLNIGTLLYDIKIKYTEILKIVTKGLFLYFVIQLFFLTIGYLTTELNSFQDLNKLNFYSLSSIFSNSELPLWLNTILSYLSIIEFIFILIISYGFKSFFNFNYAESFNFVFSIYGTGLLFWVILIAFIISSF